MEKILQANDLVTEISNILIRENSTLATAESCTGGLIANLITNVSGSSRYFKGSVISYTNKVKAQVLGVKEETLNHFTAISAETAKEMVTGVQKLMKTDYAISVTGNAGPNPSEGKEVGLVYLGFALNNKIVVIEKHFNGTRDENKINIALTALELFLIELKKR